jgi:membrane protein YdbS with pleckstrin-like domain
MELLQLIEAITNSCQQTLQEHLPMIRIVVMLYFAWLLAVAALLGCCTYYVANTKYGWNRFRSVIMSLTTVIIIGTIYFNM